LGQKWAESAKTLDKNEDKSGRGRCGRPRIDLGKLQFWEQQWFFTFKGLRDGTETNLTTWELIQDHQAWEKSVRSKRPAHVTSLTEHRQWNRGQAQRAADCFEIVEIPLKEDKDQPNEAERSVWEALKRARTPAQVRRVCKMSHYWLNPTKRAFTLSLYNHAENFLAAKADSRYPGRDRRKSGDDKRLNYLARAMAGIMHGKMSPVTSVDKLRKLKSKISKSKLVHRG